MIGYFLRALAAHFRAGRMLFALNLLGVSLGVASVLSIQIINRNALGAFAGSMRAVSGEADLTITGTTPFLPESIYPDVLSQPGIEAAWPLCRLDVSVSGGDDLSLELVGVDLFSPRRLPWEVDPDGIADALGGTGWVAITPEMAALRGWSAGSRIEVTSGSRRVPLTVGALVDFTRVAPLASRRLAVMDIAQAQSLFGLAGSLSQIDVRASAGVDTSGLAAQLADRLGPGVRVRTPEQRRQQASALLGAFRLNLTALSLISLFVGTFLVYTSTQASLVRRRLEFGLLRSLGTTRVQLIGMILAESCLLGLLGVAIGLPLGYEVARANVATVSATLSNLYLLEAIESLRLPPLLFLLGAAVGMGGALAGAVLPALDMSGRDTRELLAPFTLHEKIDAAAGRLFATGMALLALSWLWFAVWGRGWRPAGFVMGIAVLAALPLITPLAIRASCGRLPVRRFAIVYGFRSLARRLQTTSFAVAALAVAVSMLIGITLMIGSFRRTLEIWVGDTVRADIYVTTESWRRGRSEATLDAGVVDRLARQPGVRAIDRLRQTLVEVRGLTVPVSGIDFALKDTASRFRLLAGDPDRAVLRASRDGAALIGEPLANKAGLGPGDTLTLSGPLGAIDLPIAGVYYDYGSENGSVLIDMSTMRRWLGPGDVNSVALYLDPGADPEAMVERLKSRFSGLPLVIRSNRRLREEIVAIFDQTFAVTRLLQAMSLLIAVCGVTLTLLVLARERVSELALYRALGARRREIFRVFLGQGLGMAAVGLALGAAGGVTLAMILIFIINRAWFGWTIAVHWPWIDLAVDAAVILAATVLASLYPAMRAGRTPATELTRDDL